MLIIIHNKQCLLALLVVVPDQCTATAPYVGTARTHLGAQQRRERQAGEAMQAPPRRRSSAATQSQSQQLGVFGRGRRGRADRGVAFGAWRSSLVMATTPPTPQQRPRRPLRFYPRAGTDKIETAIASSSCRCQLRMHPCCSGNFLQRTCLPFCFDSFHLSEASAFTQARGVVEMRSPVP